MNNLTKEVLIKINELQKQESKILQSIYPLLESEPELTLEALGRLGQMTKRGRIV
jgi:hypothetical protein